MGEIHTEKTTKGSSPNPRQNNALGIWNINDHYVHDEADMMEVE
jgi:hypothetical protein